MTYIAELVLFLCIIIIVVKLILDYLDWKNTIYTLTDKRIIIKRGLFNKEKISMPYIKVQDIDVSQSVLERMMGAGDIVIYGGHDNVETILDEVPNPREVEEIILNQVNKLNYSYNQAQAPHGYNSFENYNDNQGNMQNNYDNSMNTPGYNRGYNQSN
ncbi:MAG: PH domain-containing protein, partial [Methanosphaera sp.]|nr:PH domain-containing protein [Methanosphaera sp.]